MKNKLWLTLLLLSGLVFTANAAYFSFLPYKIVQPDGMEIACFASGDEYFNWLHDKDGYTIIQASDGYYYYGVVSGELVIPSSFLVNSVDPATAGLKKWAKISLREYNQRKDYYSENVDKSVKAPHNGTLNNIVIYIHFNDDPEFTTPRQTFDDKLNLSVGPSLKSYYSEVSYNSLHISSTHYPACAMNTNYSYKDSHNRNYFQPYNATTNPAGYNGNDERRLREHGLLRDAVAWINANYPVPGSLNLDGDDDGKVDNVCFIVEGTNGAWADLLWAHRWVLYSYYVTINGKQVYDYTFQPETQVDVTTLCHEMFHSLGAPDLYHYSYDGFVPVGDWDIMESGKGSMGAYMKWNYAGSTWIDSIPIIRKSGIYTLNPLSSPTRNCYQIPSPNSPFEYFIVEYRQALGMFEKNIPGTGLLVYRIDPSIHGNASGPPDEVYIFRPGGTHTTNGNPSYAYYSKETGRTALNDSTNPASFLQDGTPGGLNISAVSSATDTISFTVNLSTIRPPVPFAARAFSSSQNRLSWSKNSNGNDVMIATSRTPVFGFPDDGTLYPVGTTVPGGGTIIYSGQDTTFEITGLSTNTTYYYATWSVTADHRYSPAVFCQATTFCETILYLPFTESFEDTSASINCWTQQNSNPAWEFLTGNGNGAGHGFPATAHSGTRNALLKDMTPGSDQNYLYSPVFDLSGYTDVQLSFWLFMKSWVGRQDVLKLFYRNNSNDPWTLLQSYDSSIGQWTQESMPLTTVSSSFQLAFQGDAKEGFGICLDDVEINGNPIYSVNITPGTQEVSPAAGSFDFTVTSNTSWTAVCDSSWCTVTSSGNGSGTLTVSYTENYSAMPRVAHIIVAADGVHPQAVALIQRGRGVSVAEEEVSKINIFPNPADGKFSIVVSGFAGQFLDATILDVSGRNMLKTVIRGDAENHLDLSGYPGGFYFVEIMGTDFLTVKHLVVTK